MFFEWNHDLEIGVPEIDAEHRYLVALVNNLHERFTAGEMEAGLTAAFTHLVHYINRHFRNEETLMELLGHPGLETHREQHEGIDIRLSELAESFLEDGPDISTDLMEFLKAWVTHHVTHEDKQIAECIGGRDVHETWEHQPAWSGHSDHDFKRCTCCDRRWPTLESLLADDTITAVNCMVDARNPFFNLILFNCTCGTTLTIPLPEFLEAESDGFELEDHPGRDGPPPWCLKKNPTGPCRTRCACAYTRSIMDRMGQGAT